MTSSSNDPAKQRNPYVGPRPLDQSDEIFGRDREISDLYSLVLSERIVLLYSPTGAGKSSILAARNGLVSRLKSVISRQDRGDGSKPKNRFTLLPTVRVGIDLNNSKNRFIASALQCLQVSDLMQFEEKDDKPVQPLQRSNISPSPQQPHSNPQPSPTSVPATVPTPTNQNSGPTKNYVFIFDQFEEIFNGVTTENHEREIKQFFIQIGSILENRHNWALFSMREDLIASLDPYVHFIPTRLRCRYRIDLLKRDEARKAIEVGGRGFSATVATTIVEDLAKVIVMDSMGKPLEEVGVYIEPLHLQIVCERMWEKGAPKDSVRLEEPSISVDSALKEYYSAKLKAIATKQNYPELTIRQWFQKEVIKNGFRAKVIGWEFLKEKSVIEDLVNAYLIRVEERQGITWYELSHDRLIKPILDANKEWLERHHLPYQRLRFAGICFAIFAVTSLVSFWIFNSHLDEVRKELADADERSRLLFSVASVSLERNDPNTFLKCLQYSGQILNTEGESAEVSGSAQTMLVDSLLRGNVMLPQTIIRAGNNSHILFSAFSSNSQVFTVSDDGTASFWSAKSGKSESTPCFQEGGIYTADITRDGNWFVTAGPKGASLWRKSGNGWEKIVLIENVKVNSVRFNPGGNKIVAACENGEAKLFDVKEQVTFLRSFRCNGSVKDARFSHENKDARFNHENQVVTACSDGVARIFNVETGYGISLIPVNNGQGRYAINDAEFSHDNQSIVTASQSGYVTVWSASDHNIIWYQKHRLAANTAEFSPNDQFVISSSDDGTACLWNGGTGAQVGPPMRHRGRVVSAHLSNNGIIVTASSDNTAALWLPLLNESLSLPMAHDTSVNFAEFNSDGAELITTANALDDSRFPSVAVVWDVRLGSALPTQVTIPGESPTSGEFNPINLGQAIVLSKTSLYLWDTSNTNTSLQKILGVQDSGLSLKDAHFSPDGQKLITSWSNDIVRLDKLKSGRLEVVCTIPQRKVFRARFDPSGSKIITISPTQVQLWDYSGTSVTKIAWSPQTTFKAIRDADITDSPNGAIRILVADASEARVFDEKGVQLGTPISHIATSARLTPDGQHFVISSEDGSATVFETETGKASSPPIELTGPINSAIFSQDGTKLVAGGEDGARILNWNLGATLTRPLPEIVTGGMSFSSNGCRLMTISPSRVSLWDVGPLGSSLTKLLLIGEFVTGRSFKQTNQPSLDTVFDRWQRVQNCKERDLISNWLLADRGSRSISPYSNLTVPEYLKESTDSDSTSLLLKLAPSQMDPGNTRFGNIFDLVAKNANLFDFVAKDYLRAPLNSGYEGEEFYGGDEWQGY